MCEILFRLAEPLEDGDDISTSLSYRPAIWFKKDCNLIGVPRGGQREKDGQQGLPIDQALGGSVVSGDGRLPSRLTAGHWSIMSVH
jgi:hypothetical protein